jgi:hypothetical protein
MKVNPISVINNNEKMMSVINTAQKSTNEIQRKFSILGMKNKLRIQANAVKGQVIDMYV